MRLCHSVWTKPMNACRWDIRGQLGMNLWLFSLSVAYAKKLGVPIVLHTDLLGKKIFGFLPYDETYLTLEDLNATDCFWAAGKIHAQSLEPLGSIHLDGDVFLKKEEMLDALNFTHYDVLIQNTENNRSIYNPLLQKFREVFSVEVSPIELDFSSHLASNCGIVGFNNQVIKDKYIDGYKCFVNVCSQNERFMNSLRKNKNFIPDLVLEQWWLNCVTSYYSCKVKSLFSDIKTLQEDAIRIGYTHLLGKSKYDLIDKVKSRLFDVNPDLYKETLFQVSKLKVVV